MERVLIAQNITREGPGYAKDILDSYGIGYKIVDPSKRGQGFPPATPFAAVIVYGGPDSANDTTPKMRQERSRVKGVLDNQKPYLGICLGGQVLGKIAGGEIVVNKINGQPYPEIGFVNHRTDEPYTVELTAEGRKDPLFDGIPNEFRVFHLHGEAVVPNEETTKVLGVGATCRTQVIKVGKNAYGIQSHVELTDEMLKRGLKEDPDWAKTSPAKDMETFREIKEEYQRTCHVLLSNFLRIAQLID